MRIGKKPLGHAIWFKLVLTLLVFIPAYSGVPYEPRNATLVIASVLAHPMIVSVPWLLPLSKLTTFRCDCALRSRGKIREDCRRVLCLRAGCRWNLSKHCAYGDLRLRVVTGKYLA